MNVAYEPSPKIVLQIETGSLPHLLTVFLISGKTFWPDSFSIDSDSPAVRVARSNRSSFRAFGPIVVSSPEIYTLACVDKNSYHQR